MTYENGYDEYEELRKLVSRFNRISHDVAKNKSTLDEKLKVLAIQKEFQKFDLFIKKHGYDIEDIERENRTLKFCECGALL